MRKRGKERERCGGRVGVIGGVCGPEQKVFWYVYPAGIWVSIPGPGAKKKSSLLPPHPELRAYEAGSHERGNETHTMFSCGVYAAVKIPRYAMSDRWGANEAVKMYHSLSAFLKKHYPRRKRWLLVEVNDPSGFLSRRAVRAKEELKIKAIGLPKRSPDLSPMDYSVWSRIGAKMREGETKMKDKKETKKAHLRRLGRVAAALDKGLLRKTMRDMRRRLRFCKEAKGGLFEE